MNSIITALVLLGTIGFLFGIIIYYVGQKFKVIESPLIDAIEELLPGANCGACGMAGCRAFAETVVRTNSLDNMFCPAGGNELNAKIAPLLGVKAEVRESEIAVVRCSGSFSNARPKFLYEGITSCSFANSLFSGTSGCPNGCLGLGDCVDVCPFDAIFIDEDTGLPIVSEEKCVACGKCVEACPRGIIEIRLKGKKNRRIFVSCINKEKGAVANKNCIVACIGCGKCVKACPHDAITLENFLAYIDDEKCTLCRKCVTECPTGSILELNFPPRKEKTIEEKETINN